MKFKNPIYLTIAALIWGFAFVAQSVGMEYVEPFTFNGVRNIIGSVVLIPVILWMNHREKKHATNIEETKDRKMLIKAGCCCGTFLFVATGFQQAGILYTSVGKAGFITAIYIVLVPIIGLLFGKKNSIRIWLSVVIALAGFYCLTMIGESSFNIGDLYLLFCALTFSGHILCVDYFSPKVNGVALASLQFLVCGVLSIIMMILFETPTVDAIFAAAVPILYAAVLSSGVAYTFQIIGQKNYNPTIAALIMSLESVFAVVAGWLILKQSLSANEGFGCILIFAAIILTQLPASIFKIHRKQNNK